MGLLQRGLNPHYAEFLRTVYFFERLQPDTLEAIARSCSEATYEPGEIVFREGEEGDRFYIVIAGEVEVWKDYDTAGARRLARQGAGHPFGEMALIDDLPRSATVLAYSHTTLLQQTREDFLRLFRESGEIAQSLLRSMSDMVRRGNRAYVDELREQNRKLEGANAELRQAQADVLRNERLSNLGKMSSMIIHDLRNPISTLVGYAQLIRANADDPKQVEDLAQRVLAEGGRLNQLAGELLDYSRGEVRLDPVAITTRDLADRFVAAVSGRLESSSMTLEVSDTCGRGMIVDMNRLLRVLENIAENARKAMRSGGVLRLDISCDADDVVFRCADTGYGMTPDVLEHIFEPFYSKSEHGGTGLGMVVVKNVVEAHGGTIDVESELGRGTTVTLRIPRTGVPVSSVTGDL